MKKIHMLGKMLFSVLLVSIISLAIIGCNEDIRESPTGAQPTIEQSTSEHPTEEHHSTEHPSEHPN